MEARDERRPAPSETDRPRKLLIIDARGFVPLSKTGAELLFELISQRDERGATLISRNLPFDEWTFARSIGPIAVTGSPFGTERLAGALLDRLTRHVQIIEMNGDSDRLGQSRARKAQAGT